MTGYQHIKYATKASDFKHVKYEVKDKIARITLNRPSQANVQSTILLEEVDHAFDRAAADPKVNVIVMSGEGKNWSARPRSRHAGGDGAPQGVPAGGRHARRLRALVAALCRHAPALAQRLRSR